MQGRKCGRLISSDDAIDKLPSQVCSNNSVRLALERPVWTPEINHMFPPRFKVMSLRICLYIQTASCRRQTPDLSSMLLCVYWSNTP